MTDEQIDEVWERTTGGRIVTDDMRAFAYNIAQEAARQEREACAKLCDEFAADYMDYARGGDNSGASDHMAHAAEEIAGEIRARSAASG